MAILFQSMIEDVEMNKFRMNASSTHSILFPYFHYLFSVLCGLELVRDLYGMKEGAATCLIHLLTIE